MSDAISSILSQIRTMQAQSQGFARGLDGVTPGVSPQQVLPGASAGADRVSFSDALKQAVNRVNESQKTSGQLRTAFELGDPKVDLTRVMLASQEAQIGFKAVVEVRNRLVQAYQEVMNMPV